MKTFINAKNLIIPFLFLPFIFVPISYQNKSIENSSSFEHSSFMVPIDEEITTNYSIEEIETGSSHSGAIINNKTTNTDELYTWGLNDQGQLGVGDNKNHDYPKKVNGLPEGDLSNLSMGDKHSAVVVTVTDDLEAEHDELYIWGDNTNGQLGLGDEGTYSTTDPDDGSTIEENISYFNTPQYLDWNDIGLEEITIKDVSLGTQVSSVVLDNGNTDDLYTWGYNAQGQLGIGYFKNEYFNYPQEISSLSNKWQINEISMGGDYGSAVINKNGDDKLYTWGRNFYGELGIGKDAGGEGNTHWSPELVTGLPSGDIEQISMGYHYGAAVVENQQYYNELYTWGDNNYGQLGYSTSSVSRAYEPKKVGELPTNENIKQVSMGYEHSSAVITDVNGIDHLYTWGKNDRGQLGLETINNPDSGPLVNYYDTPQEVMNLPATNIKNISMGKDYSMAIVNNGIGTTDYLYVWGDNEFGQLGLGYKDQTPVSTPKLWVWHDKTFVEQWYFYLIIAIVLAIIIMIIITLLFFFKKLFENRKLRF